MESREQHTANVTCTSRGAFHLQRSTFELLKRAVAMKLEEIVGKDVETGLGDLAVRLRDEQERESLDVAVIGAIQDYLISESRPESTVAAGFRALANAVAYCDNNRKAFEQKDAIFEFTISTIGHATSASVANFAIASLFNYTVDNESGSTNVGARESLVPALTNAIERFYNDDSFMDQPALSLLEIVASNEKVSETDLMASVHALLKASKANEAFELALLKLVEVNQIVEKAVATDVELFSAVLDTASTVDPEEGGQHIVAAMGNMSSRPELSELVQFTEDDSNFKRLLKAIHSWKTNSSLAAGSCCVLGNLAVSDLLVNDLLEQDSTLIDTCMEFFLNTDSYYELQGAHLIKHITVVQKFKKRVAELKADQLVQKLLDCKLFYSIRLIGVLLARNLISESPHLANTLLEAYKVEDNEAVKSSFIQAFTTAIRNGKGTKEMIQQLTDLCANVDTSKSDWAVLLRLTASLGQASKDQPELVKEVDFDPCLQLSNRIVSAADQQSIDEMAKGVVKNLGFLAANLPQTSTTHQAITNAHNLS